MIRALWAIVTNDPAARAEHFGRNRHQLHRLPDRMPDQDQIHCVVDNQLTTFVDDPGFRVVNWLFGLHEHGAWSWRGFPAQPYLEVDGAAPSSEASELSALGPDEDYQPSLQLISVGPDHRTSPTSSYDIVSPLSSVTEHFVRDVLPHAVWGGDYDGYAMSSGEDLSAVDRDDIHANIYPCARGEFVGGSDFSGIDDPVSAAGQLGAHAWSPAAEPTRETIAPAVAAPPDDAPRPAIHSPWDPMPAPGADPPSFSQVSPEPSHDDPLAMPLLAPDTSHGAWATVPAADPLAAVPAPYWTEVHGAGDHQWTGSGDGTPSPFSTVEPSGSSEATGSDDGGADWSGGAPADDYGGGPVDAGSSDCGSSGD
jgi:hypothetical protein